MTDYYLDWNNGADANNGLGPDASHATNKPWKTLTKALGATGIASGDRVFLAPGTFRETVAVAMTSPVAETKVLGDPFNEKGFKTSGGVLVAPGPVALSAFTTNDKTAPSGTTLLNLSGRDFLTFERIQFVGGSATAMVTATTTTSTNIVFRDCALLPGVADQIVVATTVFGTGFTWLFDRCYFGPTRVASGMIFNAPTGTGSDYDLDVTIRDSVFLEVGSTRVIGLTPSGAGAQKPGGIEVRNCSSVGSGTFFAITTATASTSIPCVVANCLIFTSTATALTVSAAGGLGSLTENYNLIYATTPRSNVNAGANTITNASYALLFHFGQERVWGSPVPRQFLEPLAGSPLLAFGNDGSQAATDNRAKPRPAGGGSALPAVGGLERGNTAVPDPSPIGGGGGAAVKLVGPGYSDYLVALSGAGTYTISYVVKWDGTYTGTKPQLRIDAQPTLAVATETKTATGGSGSNETLTLSAITVAKAGIVVVRLISNDTNGAGVVQADDFAVA